MENVIERLNALATLQYIDSKLDKILTLRGSLPDEVDESEFEIQGLEGKKDKVQADINELEDEIAKRKANIKDYSAAIKRYEEQINDVKNNREYEALRKEIEYANLEILTSEKRIRQYTEQIEQKVILAEDIQAQIDDKMVDLADKRKELEVIIEETKAQEKALRERSDKASAKVDLRILNAYKKVRNNMRNGLAVVTTDREACGGCFAIIPPQMHLEIRQKRKLLICENCGRMIVDHSFFVELEAEDAPRVEAEA